MFYILRRFPAVGLLLISWLLPLTLSLMVTPTTGEPLGLKTELLIFGCISAAFSGVIFGGILVPSRGVKLQHDVPTGLVMKLGVVGATIGLIYWGLAGTPHGTLEEIRQSVHDGTFTETKTVSYLAQIGGAISLLSAALASHARRPILVSSVVLVGSWIAWIGLVLHTGGRVFMLALTAVVICGLAARYANKVFSLKWAFMATLASIPVLAANVWFVEKRMQTWFDDPALGISRIVKAESLVGREATAVLDNDYATTSIWLLLQFTSDPIYYLDYYVKYIDLPLHYGLYEFSTVANRIPGYDWQKRRDIIDTMYEPIGVKTNVWGTGIRDVMVDFGAGGAVVIFLLMGLVSGALDGTRYLGGRILHVFTLVWIAYSPFNSPITLRPMQWAVFGALAWLILEFLVTRRGATRTSLLNEVPGGPPAGAAVPLANGFSNDDEYPQVDQESGRAL